MISSPGVQDGRLLDQLLQLGFLFRVLLLEEVFEVEPLLLVRHDQLRVHADLQTPIKTTFLAEELLLPLGQAFSIWKRNLGRS